MNLCVSHMSALRYWRQKEGLSTGQKTKARSLARAVSSVKDASRLHPREQGLIMSPDYPLDILVGAQQSRRYAQTLRPHLWPHEIPQGSFLRIAPSILVSTPEFLFVQLAGQLSLVELAQLGNELCGGYYLRGASLGGFEKRPDKKSITTRDRLVAYVERAGDVRGAKKATLALSWVADHCNSPMETNALLALCLPSNLGGWWLPIPSVNESVGVEREMVSYVEGTTYTPDFMWKIEVDGKEVRVTGEYDSHEYHDEDEQAEKTRIRRNAMKTMGYLVTSINKSQMNSAERLQYPARQIARDLGLRRPVPSEARLRRQNKLLRLLQREEFR